MIYVECRLCYMQSVDFAICGIGYMQIMLYVDYALRRLCYLQTLKYIQTLTCRLCYNIMQPMLFEDQDIQTLKQMKTMLYACYIGRRNLSFGCHGRRNFALNHQLVCRSSNYRYFLISWIRLHNSSIKENVKCNIRSNNPFKIFNRLQYIVYIFTLQYIPK